MCCFEHLKSFYTIFLCGPSAAQGISGPNTHVFHLLYGRVKSPRHKVVSVSARTRSSEIAVNSKVVLPTLRPSARLSISSHYYTTVVATTSHAGLSILNMPRASFSENTFVLRPAHLLSEGRQPQSASTRLCAQSFRYLSRAFPVTQLLR